MLSNKFEYGLDTQGGIKQEKEKVKDSEIQECLESVKNNYVQSNINKAKIEMQHFNVVPNQNDVNSTT